MWSDPIDNALSNVADLIRQLQAGHPPEEQNLAWLAGAVKRAEEAREFEHSKGRLLTPQDPF